MSLSHSPRIVTNDLVFYYDANNTQKSWKGAPTTNLTPNMSIQAAVAAPTVSFIGVENGWKKYSLNGTWTNGTYPYSIQVEAPTFTGGITYSTAVFIKTNVPQKFVTLFSGINYVNAPMNNAGTSFSISQTDGSIHVGRSGFQYTNTTAQAGYLLSQPVIGQTFNGATDFVFIRQGQIEIGSFPTPFVNGTRLNTQSIIDLTGNNTITANSLTYASDGTFSFPGNTLGNLDLNTQSLITELNPFTIESWTNKTADNYGAILNNYGSGYTTGLWWATAGLFISGGSVYHADYANSMAGIHHSAVTRDFNGNVVLYRDGVQVNTGTLTGLIPANINWRIGGDVNGGGEALTGNIYNLKTYSRVLSAAEIKQNFNAHRGRYVI